MSLTFLERRRPLSQHFNGFPLAQLGLLAIVRLAEPVALTSILPYAYKLVLKFQVADSDHAAFFAGILVASFSLAEACSCMFWGGMSDKYGRRNVLLLGCAGTLLSLLIVGFSVNFWMALAGRILGGLLNGNIGVIQTMVGELITQPEHEAPAFAIMPFVWAIGSILGPVIGGLCAEPTTTYPNMFDPAHLFERFPYLLPNLVCASLLGISMVVGGLYLRETHPDMQPWSTQEELDCTTVETPLIPTTGGYTNAPADLRNDAYGTFDSVDMHQAERWDIKASGRAYAVDSDLDIVHPSAFPKRVVMLVIALGIFTYHSMAFDHLLPIYLEDNRPPAFVSVLAADSNVFAGGLGLSLSEVGFIMSMNGIIALFVQAAVFPPLTQVLGNWKLFVLVTVGHPIPLCMMTYLPYYEGAWLKIAIYTTLIIRNLFSILAYPLLLILLKQASPAPVHLGKINGLAASTGAACRTLASPTVGYLYGVGSAIGYTPLAWWCTAVVASAGVLQLCFMQRQKGPDATVTGPLPCRLTAAHDDDNPVYDVVTVHIRDDSDSQFSDTDDDAKSAATAIETIELLLGNSD